MTNEQSDADFLRELAHYTSTLSHENEARVRRIADLLDTFALEPREALAKLAGLNPENGLPDGSLQLNRAAEPKAPPRMEPRIFRGNGPDCLGCGKTLAEHLTNYNFCPELPENREAKP